MRSLRLVTVAHGTRTAVGNLVAAEITRLAGAHLGVPATVSYVELCEPLLADVVRDGSVDADGGWSVDTPTVVVPLLLSTGYHVRKDLPEAVAPAGPTARLCPPLGPDPLLAEAMVDRLRTAGAQPGQPVVLVASGSSDPDALVDLELTTELLGARWGAPARLATMAGLGPRIAEVVRPGDAVAPYLLATGHFARRAAEEARAAGATVVADVIGAHPAVVRLVARRALGAVGAGSPSSDANVL